ncbi:hypothetical protein [Psychroflexus montanilacus]|uniref:hypothetical protein n=1 Tax=Psychroflexus montanilacus TaxID=2873598 RepID=UPI001CCBB5FC|nr:hypothetical protein [Psychroflexus montanilacus]MBZ9652084.1 hypothetical protein [Psychroflexus montanilacus]
MVASIRPPEADTQPPSQSTINFNDKSLHYPLLTEDHYATIPLNYYTVYQSQFSTHRKPTTENS